MISLNHRSPALTCRGALVLWLMCWLPVCGYARRGNLAVATDVRHTVSGTSTRIIIHGTAPMAYAVRRPDAQTVSVELPGVDVSQLAATYAVSSSSVAGVTVDRLGSNSSGRIRVHLRAPVRDRSYITDNNLVLELQASGAPTTSTAPVAAPDVEIASAAQAPSVDAVRDAVKRTAYANQQTSVTNQTTQQLSQQSPTLSHSGNQTTPQGQVSITPSNSPATVPQGPQYGQPGFVGEPLNLNVVNADIRDILQFITSQYDVNFVIDKSVGAVPVTVTINDVPWNTALDAILRANRLGIEVTGNILRVATLEVLAGEAAIQQQVRAAQLNNSPLVTEFIRLNYARASGTLAGAAGSTGGFAGGATNQSFSGGAGGDATGGGGDQGILPIISRRLSTRGSVEVDGRSNTLIVTDVQENIAAIRQLVALLDQPEPQVEIEARIVIASRNFSRDLGVQLNALAFNTGTGGTAGFGTAQGSPQAGGAGGGATNTIGLRPSGIPQGILNASGALGANSPSTVIGLTTGIIGTAQISALITAAEAKGQAKIVATPRVTALNNRPAQIEAGQQIPVITPQVGGAGGAGGAGLVFTTTFVSVPLRLSVTPQITDAGTVVLRIVSENNSIRQDIAVAGTPGIDTQRMQSEVLVPDGGTTVMGGVLNDQEAETQNRTPGLGTLPVLGNLFKRKATSRNTQEILFFITPRIYRPDYQGRPMDSAPSTGPRTRTIPQPVPLGNPPTNTPPPNSLQQGVPQQTFPQQPVTPQNPALTPALLNVVPAARPDAAAGGRP